LQQNKHNEQQPFNPEILRNLGNARENPNVGKPNEREREIYYSTSGKYISATISISSSKINPLTTH
jgi:hypothetical protein